MSAKDKLGKKIFGGENTPNSYGRNQDLNLQPCDEKCTLIELKKLVTLGIGVYFQHSDVAPGSSAFSEAHTLPSYHTLNLAREHTPYGEVSLYG